MHNRPGALSKCSLPAEFAPEVLDTYNILSVDQRGMGKSALKTGLGFKACDEGYRKNQKGTSNATVSLALEKGVKDSETMAEAVDLYEGTDQMELPRHPRDTHQQGVWAVDEPAFPSALWHTGTCRRLEPISDRHRGV